VSDDAIAHSLSRYQTLLAARQQDPEPLRDAYRDSTSWVRTLDGLHPEKGHETFDVVRELMRKRGWCAEPLLSRATQEGHRLLVLARQWGERLDKPVRVGMSDKQEAFVTAIATAFPGTPHRYCQNHCRRDVAKPVLDMDSHAKVKMRHKVRDLRAIERRGLEARRHTVTPEPTAQDETPKTAGVSLADSPEAGTPPREAAPVPCGSSDLGLPGAGEPDVGDEAGEVVRGYCAAVRGMRNDGPGGPLHPPG
jgi:hypothetical protein